MRDRIVGRGVRVVGHAHAVGDAPQAEVAAADAEGRLGDVRRVDDRQAERRGVEHAARRRHPRALRQRGPEEHERTLGGVALLDVGEPLTPAGVPVLGEHVVDLLVPHQQAYRARRVAGSRGEQRDPQLTALERAVHRRQERDEQGDDAEPEHRLGHRGEVGGHVAGRREAERGERRAADDERSAQRIDAEAPEDRGERHDDAERPRPGQRHQRDRGVEGHDAIPVLVGAGPLGDAGEQHPGRDEHGVGQRHVDRPRQHDRPDGRQQDPCRRDAADHGDEQAKGSHGRWSLRRRCP